jgi:predicted dehydrogenase
MDKVFRWGIIGPGKIARKFAAALQLVPNASLYAVASRDGKKAAAFAAEFKAPVHYDSYEALAEDDSIDVVYIATPHTFHHAHALLCLRKKKAVLCEKPMSVSYESTLELVTAARQNGVFLMEAMWTRFLPVIEKTLELVNSGTIGSVKYLQADFGFYTDFNAASRLYDMKLGGGALLDIGVYPLFLALLILGKPDDIKSFSHVAPSGADITTSALLYYNNGVMANILCSIVAETPLQAEIMGTEGSIIIGRPWYKGAAVHVRKKDTVTAVFALPYGDNGFEFQVREVQACLANGAIESKFMSHDFSLLMSSTAENILQTANICYSLQP